MMVTMHTVMVVTSKTTPTMVAMANDELRGARAHAGAGAKYPEVSHIQASARDCCSLDLPIENSITVIFP